MSNPNPKSNVVSYFQGCPVCGRTLRISVSLIGSRVYCQHCGGGFVASGEEVSSPAPVSDGQPDVAARADELLELVARVLDRTGG
jgi:hypothetical protein